MLKKCSSNSLVLGLYFFCLCSSFNHDNPNHDNHSTHHHHPSICIMSTARKVFNLTNLTIVIVVAYLYVVVNNLYKLMNPMANVVVDPFEETINPLWDKNQEFSLICFLSISPKFSQFSVSKLEKDNRLLIHLSNLTFHNENDADHIEINLNIADSNDSSNSTTTGNSVHVPSDKIWKSVQNNQSAVFLHALTVKHTDTGEPPDLITRETINSGQGAYGIINLIKYDHIPKSFRHRYLLSDFGFEDLGTEIEVAQAALPGDTVISFWKPEVAVRLVTDFTLYPLNHDGKCVFILVWCLIDNYCVRVECNLCNACLLFVFCVSSPSFNIQKHCPSKVFSTSKPSQN